MQCSVIIVPEILRPSFILIINNFFFEVVANNIRQLHAVCMYNDYMAHFLFPNDGLVSLCVRGYAGTLVSTRAHAVTATERSENANAYSSGDLSIN